MNYGRQGIKQKKKLLNSAATRLRTKLGVFAIKFILILAIAVVVSGSCLVLGSVQGIISSAPEVSTIDVSPDGFATKIYDNESNEIQTLSTTGNSVITGTDNATDVNAVMFVKTFIFNCNKSML